MQEADLFEIFIIPLSHAGIQYCITGSIASMLYGEPRLTHDVDLIVDLGKLVDIRKLPEVFPAQSFYLPPEEIIRIEAAEG